MTAICLLRAEGPVTRLVQTRVQFVQLVRAQCEAYLATDEPWDKAGGYAIQGRGGVFVEAIKGSYSGVMGLPVFETAQLLAGAGINIIESAVSA